MSLALAALAMTAGPAAAQSPTSAIIDNGTVQLGVNAEGHLNTYEGGYPSSGGTTAVGLRYLPTSNESTAPGCLCEGWGVADPISGVSGWANVAQGGTSNLTLLEFSPTGSTALSRVQVGNTFEITHNYAPSTRTDDLYRVEVTIKNISAQTVDARYRRVMDWDIEPTAFAEYVTLQAGTAANLLYSSNNGFASSDPLTGPSDLGQVGSFTDAGPDDHGALFDFGFGELAPGEEKSFFTYYGASGTENGALDALAAVGAEAYSFGQPSTEGGPTLGTPNTFIFAFGGVGGAAILTTASVGDTSVTEGGVARFVVSLAEPANNPVTVDYTTAEGSARAGSDFAARTGTLTIPAGETQGTVEVPTIDDNTVEPSETFNLELSNAQGAVLDDASGTATITDNDLGPPARTEPREAAPPLEVSVDPTTATYTQVVRHTLTATVRRDGTPVGGELLRLQVTGANERSESDRSDPEGRVYFSWVGQANGTDTAVVFVDGNGDGEPQTGEPSARATVTWRGGLPRSIETADSIEELSRPGLFQDANFEPVGSGEVLVKLPASLTAQTVNKGFIPLREAAQLPVGTIINTDQGRVAIQSAVRSRTRRLRSADFYGGTFQFTQPRSRAATTEMVMTGGSFRQECSVSKRRRSRGASADGPDAETSRRRGGRTVRRLWGSGKGRFRTRGRYSSATVRGTRWLVEDRCEGTLTRVRTGTVTVRDFPRRSTVTVRAGRSHFAARRAPRSLTK